MSKVVAITGAGSGIGAATARLLAHQGMTVVLGSRGAKELDAVAQSIAQEGGQVAARTLDVSRRDEVSGFVAFARERFGRLDVLVSNAGVMPIGPLDDLAVDDWERMVDVNVKGLLFGIAAALPVFREQGSGQFVNIASTAARKTTPNQTVYSATKAAVLALSDGLRQELAGKLRVTVISPGFTDTAFARHVRDDTLRGQMEQAAGQFAMNPQAVAKAIAYAIDQPEEINIGEVVIRSLNQP